MPRKQQSNRRPKGQRAQARSNMLALPSAYATKNSRPREASLRLRNSELWTTLTAAGLKTFSFLPGTSSLPILDAEALRFDLYRIKSARLRYVPLCATTQAGNVVLAVDYDSQQLPPTAAAVNAIVPQVRPQCFRPAELSVDPSRANKQIWLRTANGVAGANTAFVAVTATNISTAATVGEIWLDYDVELSNPRQVSVAYSAYTYKTNGGTETFDDGQKNADSAGWTASSTQGPSAFFYTGGVYEFIQSGMPDGPRANFITELRDWVARVGAAVYWVTDPARITQGALIYFLRIPQLAIERFGTRATDGRYYLYGPILSSILAGSAGLLFKWPAAGGDSATSLFGSRALSDTEAVVEQNTSTSGPTVGFDNAVVAALGRLGVSVPDDVVVVPSATQRPSALYR